MKDGVWFLLPIFEQRNALPIPVGEQFDGLSERLVAGGVDDPIEGFRAEQALGDERFQLGAQQRSRNSQGFVVPFDPVPDAERR